MTPSTRNRLPRFAGYFLLVLLMMEFDHATRAADRVPRINLGTLAPRGSSFHQALQAMGEQWRQAPNGGARLVIYPDGTQGGEADMVRLMRLGSLQAGLLSGVGLSDIEPAVTGLQNMPMVFRNLDEVEYANEKLGPMLEKRLADKGFVVLFWGDAGWVRYFSTKPILTPEDLKQNKIFVWAGNPAQMDIMKRSGYNPVALEAAEMKKLAGFYAKYPPSTPMMVGTTEEVRVDEANNEIYVAENYLGGRVLVFDLATLAFKRGWGAYGKKLADISTDPADHQWVGTTPPKDFQSHLTIAISRDGMVYAADRAAERVQAFTREGKFVKEFVVALSGTRRDERTGSRGAAGGVTFSADKEQRHLYVSDMKNNTIWFLNRADGTVLGRFGSMGDNGGQFFGLDLAATDSQGYIYTGEVFSGERVQRLVPADSPRGKLLEQLSRVP